MKIKRRFFILIAAALVLVLVNAFARQLQVDDRFVNFITQPKNVALYWKDGDGRRYGSIANLKRSLDGKSTGLRFAMNGGMFKPDFSPQGLFIQNASVLSPLDTSSGGGNFYLKPNGVFFITKTGKGVIVDTKSFHNDGQIRFATQSGPLLIIGGKIHPAFKEGSANLNIRNGVGILPDGNVVFAISKVPVNFYDLAVYFKSIGCSDALYLDGFVSRMYLPEKSLMQTDGDFGVMIGVSSK